MAPDKRITKLLEVKVAALQVKRAPAHHLLEQAVEAAHNSQVVMVAHRGAEANPELQEALVKAAMVAFILLLLAAEVAVAILAAVAVAVTTAAQAPMAAEAAEAAPVSILPEVLAPKVFKRVMAKWSSLIQPDPHP